jgi:hypothetical protein
LSGMLRWEGGRQPCAVVGVDERMTMTNVWLEIFQNYAGTKRGERRKDDDGLVWG